MTHEEKRAWLRLFAGVIAYVAYLIIILGRANGQPLPEVPYATALLWTIGAGIAGAIVAEIGLAAVIPGASRARDVRDREIGRRGDHIGQSFVVIGGVAAMLMAMADWHQFWIANVIYLCFALSSLLGSVAKVVVYRRGLPTW
jgi:hypothetical protein